MTGLPWINDLDDFVVTAAQVLCLVHGLARLMPNRTVAIEAAALRSTRGAIILLAILLLGWQALAWQARRVSAPREDDLDLFQAQLDEATQLKL